MNEDSAVMLKELLDHTVRNSRLSLTFSISDPTHDSSRRLVEFSGADVPWLLARNAELLLALEHVAAKALRLEPEEHDQISFDAGGFKAQRERQLERAAERGIEQVRRSGQPFAFPPMSSRERRLLHLALASSGLVSLSEGEGPTRHLVLHPARSAGSVEA